MVRIETPRSTSVVGGVQHIIADVQASTMAELILLNGTISGAVLDAGSIVQEVQTGDYYTLDANGSWYNADGSGAYTPA